MMADVGLGSWPMRRARIDPDAIALCQGQRTLTYGELADRVDRLAQAFYARGVRAGDRVAHLGPNDIATFETFFASNRLGAIFVPLNWRLATSELNYLVGDCQPKILIHAPAFAPVVAQLPVPSVAVGEPFEAMLNAGPAGWPVGENPGTEIRQVEVTLDDDAVILYTSGTTGKPKGVVLTHANLTFNMLNQLAHVDVLSSDVAMCMCPLFHATGLGQVSLPTLFKGGTVIVMPKFDPATALATIAARRVASFSAVPTMLQRMADHPDFAGTDLSSLRYAIYGGSAVLERAAVAWHQRGVQVLQGFGMTEAAPGVTMARPEGAADRPLSIGLPHFFTDISFDVASDRVAPGESGELLVRGPNVFGGYWNQPAETAARCDQGWYRTGDVVRIADDGWAYVTDRITDLIISGGENIYPSEVEAALMALPGVADCAVVGVSDEQWGEVGAAFVVCTDGALWTQASMRAALAEHIATFKVPKWVNFVTELPRTATGKVQKKQLLADYPAKETDT